MRDERRSHTFVEFGLLCVVPGVVRASSLCVLERDRCHTSAPRELHHYHHTTQRRSCH